MGFLQVCPEKELEPKFQELQRRIIEHLTPYQVERQVTFKARRKG